MNCYVKDYEWDEDIGKGWVLVGIDDGPDLGVDVEHNFILPDEAWIMRCMWSTLYTEAEDEEKHRIQCSYSGRDEYYECALDFIEKLLKEER